MKYRIAKPEDLEGCTECIKSTGYFLPVDFKDIGGTVLLAEDKDGIQGVVWACRSGKLAFADYLAVTPKYQGSGLGARLLLKGIKVLKELGVDQIRTTVHYDNTAVLSMYQRLAIMDGPYAQVALILRKEDHGSEENNHD